MASNRKIAGLTVEVNGDATGLKKTMKDATKYAEDAQKSLKTINKNLELKPKNTELLAQKQKIVTEAIKETEEAIRELKAQQKELDDGNVDKTNSQYQELQLKISQCEEKLKQLNKEVTSLAPNTQAFVAKMEQASVTLDTISDKTRTMSRVFGALGIASIKSAVDYESSIAQIQKVVKDLSEDSIAELKDIAVETGTAFSEIAEYATIAGTLGIAEKDISSFARTMQELNTATDGSIAGEEGAKMVARLMNVFGEDIADVQRFGSAVTFVSDQFAATADEVLETANNMSGLSAIAGITVEDVIGLSAEMKNLGIASTSGASAISRTFLAMNNSVVLGDKKLQTFAETAGMTAKEFQDAWNAAPTNAFLRFINGLSTKTFDEINAAIKTGDASLQSYADALEITSEDFKRLWAQDAAGTFERYADALGGLEEGTESASVVLKDVGLSGVRVAQTLLKLAGNGDVAADAISDANKAWGENVALADKANTMYQTTESRLKGAWEAIKQAGAELADALLPWIDKATDGIKDLSKWFSGLSENTQGLALAFVALGAGISPVSKMLSNSIRAVSGAVTAYGKFGHTLDELYLKEGAFGRGIDAMAKALGTKTVGGTLGAGIGLAGAAVAAAAGLAYLVHEAQTAKTGLQIVTESFAKMNESFADVVKTSDAEYQASIKNVQAAKSYSTAVDELIDKLHDQSLTEEEAAKVKEDITYYIGRLNEMLGNEAFAFDEATGKLTYQQEEIRKTGDMYDSLALKIQKSAWVEAHKDDLMAAEQQLIESQKMLEDAKERFFAAGEGYSEDLLGRVMELFGEGTEIGDIYKKLFDEGFGGDMDQGEAFRWLAPVVEKAREMNAAFEEQNLIVERNAELMQQMEDVENADTMNQFAIAIGAVGDAANITYESVEDLEAKLSDARRELSYLQNFGGTSDEVGMQEDYIRTLEEAIEKEKEAMSIFADKTQFMEMEMAGKTSLENIKKAATASPIKLVFEAQADTASIYNTISSLVSQATSALSSTSFGGLGGSISRSMGNVRQVSMGSAGYSSRSAGSITLNNTINVNNNGSSISQSTVNGWARSMVNVINDELGRMV